MKIAFSTRSVRSFTAGFITSEFARRSSEHSYRLGYIYINYRLYVHSVSVARTMSSSAAVSGNDGDNAPVAVAEEGGKKKQQKKTVAKSTASHTKKTVDHPPYGEMIRQALVALKERGGSSRQAILKYVMANFKVGADEHAVNTRLKVALRNGVKSELLKQSKGSGASGSFRLGADAKKEKAAGAAKKSEKKPKAAAEKKSAASPAKKKPEAKKVARSVQPAKKTKTVAEKKQPAAAKKEAPKAKPVAKKPKAAAAGTVEKKAAKPKKAAAQKKVVSPKKTKPRAAPAAKKTVAKAVAKPKTTRKSTA